MAAAHDVQALLRQLDCRGKLRLAQAEEAQGIPAIRALPLSWPELDAVLPDGGLPPGVVELAAPRALGGSTSVALAAVRAGQARGPKAWCAWLDPESTLYAPGITRAGVDLTRLLVVRPPREGLARLAVKVALSGAFEVVVIDFDPVPRAAAREAERGGRRPAKRGWAPQVVVRKLALATESNGATVVLLTDASKPRALPWPVSLRVDLSRPGPGDLAVRIAKDKRGRVGVQKVIPFRFSLAANDL